MKIARNIAVTSVATAVPLLYAGRFSTTISDFSSVAAIKDIKLRRLAAYVVVRDNPFTGDFIMPWDSVHLNGSFPNQGVPSMQQFQVTGGTINNSDKVFYSPFNIINIDEVFDDKIWLNLVIQFNWDHLRGTFIAAGANVTVYPYLHFEAEVPEQ